MSLNLLYLSCHETMEFDELTIFKNLGFNIFSIGYYLDPKNPINPTRTPIDYEPRKDLVDKFNFYHGKSFKPNKPFLINKDFLKEFDIIVASHYPEWFFFNQPNLSNKFLIRRSVGLSCASFEYGLLPFRKHGMKVIRYSPRESTIPHYHGTDMVIRCSIDPNEFNNWNGADESVFTVQKTFKKSGAYTNIDFYEKATLGLKRVLCGLHNEDIPYAHTDVPYETLKQYMRDSRVAYVSCARPAPLTYALGETMMTGCPIVTMGPKEGNFHQEGFGQTFEVHELIDQNINGFWSDNPQEVNDFLVQLMKDHELAKQMSLKSREKALKLFHPEIILNQWKEFFNNNGIKV